MTAGFAVLGTPRFRGYRKLLKSHSDLAAQYARVLSILGEDPYNRSGSHPIRKLASVKPGDGQFRIKFQRYRFFYAIDGQTVFPHALPVATRGHVISWWSFSAEASEHSS